MPNVFGRVRAEHVQVHRRVGVGEHTVLVPGGLPQNQAEPDSFQVGNVGGLVGGVGHDEVDIDDRFGGQAGDCGTADMLDGDLLTGQSLLDCLGLLVEDSWPARIVRGENDRFGFRGTSCDPRGGHLFRVLRSR